MRIAVLRGRCVTPSISRRAAESSKSGAPVYHTQLIRQCPYARYLRRSSSHSCSPRRVSTVPRAAAASAFGLSVPMLQAVLAPVAVAVTIWSTAAIAAWFDARKKTALCEITSQPTQFNKGVLSRCPTINTPYQAWPFLTNGHVETIFASKTRRSPDVKYDRESFGCPDGGTVHLDYHQLPGSIVGSM